MTKETLIKKAEALCKKFVGKVENGQARSHETYRECKDFLDALKDYREQLIVKNISRSEAEKGEGDA